MVIMASMFLGGISVLAIYMVVYRIVTLQTLEQHQREWDTLKEALPDDDNIIFEHYKAYCEDLRFNRSWVGACFPRM